MSDIIAPKILPRGMQPYSQLKNYWLKFPTRKAQTGRAEFVPILFLTKMINRQTNNFGQDLAATKDCTYLLTIRRVNFDSAEAQNFKSYFETLAAAGCTVLVVDGSPENVFQLNHQTWAAVCRHAPVDPQYKFLNGKVNGIHTGVELSQHERIILADDDIRYTVADVRRMYSLLDQFEMVRPQNYLRPLPVWARTESARMLINRAWLFEGDYTGTLGVRQSAMRLVGHYDGDVLFDNEEIVRHFRLHARSVCCARDFFILKTASTFQKWIEQRPRQAYEDFTMRLKTLFFLALPIDGAFAWLVGGWSALLIFWCVVAIGSIFTAALGLGDGALRFFPATTIFYAPLWIIERSFSTYWAYYWRFTRGGYPFGDKILSKGTGDAWQAGKSAAAVGGNSAGN